MRAAAREYFTVDLHGLRTALAARAADQHTTEANVLRSALAAALGANECDASIAKSDRTDAALVGDPIKLSVRLTRPAAHRLDHDTRAAGLSRGVYLGRLIHNSPPVMASADRSAGFAALSASSTELAVLSRDINHLTQLLRRGAVDAARQYRERLDNLDVDVRAHLEKAALTLADVSAGAFKPRSPP
jgi:hypothetical protein